MHLRVEKSCPISKTHNRLRQTHDLWHEMQSSYPDADDFVTKLNACVQAARSVTFVLQKELRHQDWFEGFYTPWQAEMKRDTRMRWLLQARNAIEKEGDLDTCSVAHVSVAVTDHEQSVAELTVPPLASPEQVAEAVKLEGLPERIRKQAVMVVERRWTVPELPDDELLDTLGHCYGVLASILRGAHERCGVEMRTFGGEAHGSRHDREAHPSGRLGCMLPTVGMRTAYWHLGKNTPLDYEVVAQHSTAEQLEEARKRYEIGGGRFGLEPGLAPMEQAAALHNVARSMLVKDGYHVTLAWVQAGSDLIGQYSVDSADHQDKVVKMRWLAGEVQRTGADTVIFTTETWWAPDVGPADPRFALRAGEREDRQEALLTFLLQRSREHQKLTTIFRRDRDDRPVLEKTTSDRFDGGPIFEPILRVWQSWDAEAEPPH